jgi:SAM-dependent methyltransferase
MRPRSHHASSMCVDLRQVVIAQGLLTATTSEQDQPTPRESRKVTSSDKPTDKPLSGFVAKLTAMRGEQSSLDVYEPWAQSYEEDLISEYGYIAPRIAADAFAQANAELDGPVIDFGCGTGLVGIELAQHGYSHINGIDISPAMLEQAKDKGVYRQLLQGDLSARTSITDNTYASAIAVGCFGSGHLGPEHLGELIRSVRTGGIIVLYANGIPYLEDDYPTHLQDLEALGWWTVIKTEQSNYMGTLERPGWVVVARRGDAVIGT